MQANGQAKDRYLGLIGAVAAAYGDPSRQKTLKQYSTISYRVTSYLASMEGLLYQRLGRLEDAERARRCLVILCGENIGEFGLHAAALAYDFIRDSGVLSEEDHQQIRDRLIQSALSSRERRLAAPPPRIRNHATFGMAGSEMIARLFPERKERRLLSSYAEQVWNEWWAIRENPEVTSLYEPFTQTSLIRAAELRGMEDQYFSDAVVKAAFERYLQHLSPLGVMSQYGDSGWAQSWGFWAAVFEKAASHYSDGRFKWAARRILDYAFQQKFWKNARNAEKKGDLPLATRHAIDAAVLLETYGLVLAALWSDDGVNERIPRTLSTVTHRWLPTQESPFVTGERAEEKLVLRSGWDEQDMFLMVALLKRMWHHQYDAGAVLMLTCSGSVLLHDTGYFWHEPRFHNGLLVRAEGEEFLGPQKSFCDESHYSVALLSEHSRACFASVKASRPQGYPVEHTRTIIFGKESHIIAIWDVVTILDGRYRVGPTYHTQRIVAHGENYFDATHEFMRDGTSSVRWANTPYNLLISFPLRAGPVRKGTPPLRPGVWDGYYEPAWIPLYMEGRTQHECVYQAAVGNKGERKSFLTLLIPHSHGEDTGGIARGIRVLSSDALSCCVRVGAISLLFNDGAKVSNDLITTDGKLVCVEEAPGRKHVTYCDASEIILQGNRCLAEIDKSSGEVML